MVMLGVCILMLGACIVMLGVCILMLHYSGYVIAITSVSHHHTQCHIIIHSVTSSYTVSHHHYSAVRLGTLSLNSLLDSCHICTHCETKHAQI